MWILILLLLLLFAENEKKNFYNLGVFKTCQVATIAIL